MAVNEIHPLEKGSWLTVTGFGSHISASGRTITVRKGCRQEEYPLQRVRHLMIMGGHTLQTSAVLHLMKQGSFISFFTTDGVPLGTTAPFGENVHFEVHDTQRRMQGHRYATEVIRHSCKKRILFLEELSCSRKDPLLMQGELEILHQALAEIEYLVTMEELRRVFRLVTQMYYEILARSVPPGFGFRRRTPPPQMDIINAVLTFGYAMLFGNGIIPVVAAGLDPDLGFLHQGDRSLVYDMIEVHKVSMIDRPVFSAVWNRKITEEMAECREPRCILPDALIRSLISLFKDTLDHDALEETVRSFTSSLMEQTPFSPGG